MCSSAKGCLSRNASAKVNAWCFVRASAPIQGDTISVRVEGVEAGRYAVMAFHDADSNEEVGTNWIGMPKEGVAASNWTGRRPRFDDSALQIAAGMPTVDLTLRYR